MYTYIGIVTLSNRSFTPYSFIPFEIKFFQQKKLSLENRDCPAIQVATQEASRETTIFLLFLLKCWQQDILANNTYHIQNVKIQGLQK